MEHIYQNLHKSALERLTETFVEPVTIGDDRLTDDTVFLPLVEGYNFDKFESLNELVEYLIDPENAPVGDPDCERYERFEIILDKFLCACSHFQQSAVLNKHVLQLQRRPHNR